MFTLLCPISLPSHVTPASICVLLSFPADLRKKVYKAKAYWSEIPVPSPGTEQDKSRDLCYFLGLSFLTYWWGSSNNLSLKNSSKAFIFCISAHESSKIPTLLASEAHEIKDMEPELADERNALKLLSNENFQQSARLNTPTSHCKTLTGHTQCAGSYLSLLASRAPKVLTNDCWGTNKVELKMMASDPIHLVSRLPDVAVSSSLEWGQS